MRPDFAAARALGARPPVARLLAVLDQGCEETRIVGGAVRNALIGRPVHEVDFATTALPEVTMRRAADAGLRSVPTGIRHGTVTVLVGPDAFEVTTLREDIETDGRHAVVRFGRDFAQDAERRDFTINALSLDRGGRVHDTVGGLPDLAAGRVRFIGEADLRIREDYLRILRFFRFTAEYASGAVDPHGLAAAIRGRDGLAQLSRERVRAELLKLVVARRAVATVTVLQDAGLLARLCGGVAELGRLHRATAADAGGRDAALRLAALCVRIREDADRLRDLLRLSNAEHGRLLGYAGALARLMSGQNAIDEAEMRRLVATLGVEPVRDVCAALAGEPRPGLTEAARTLLAAFASGERAPPRFPLTGADLVRAGVPPGPELGRRLAAAKTAWLAAGCPENWPAGRHSGPESPDRD